MAEPELGPVADHVRRFDPALFRTALFAPEPGRGRLMTLYAFDIELSRALSRTAEPMISLMRLQWWRDCVAAAGAGEPPRVHEVATPLHALLAERALPAELLEGLIVAREMEVEGLTTRDRFDRWAGLRFAGLTRLAAGCLIDRAAAGAGTADCGCSLPLVEAAGPAGRALAIAFALRNAVPMAAETGRSLLPDLADQSRAALARGRTDEALRGHVRDLAEDGLGALATARSRRSDVPAGALPAFLPLSLAAPVLRRARRPGLELTSLAAEGAGGAVPMLWRVLTGRW